MNELIGETTMEDIPERYREVAEIIGVRKFAALSNYAMGDEIYFPKVENLVIPARNRRIRNEYRSGSSDKELSKRYNLTIPQVWKILKDEPPYGQMTFDEYFKMNAGE